MTTTRVSIVAGIHSICLRCMPVMDEC